MTSGFCLLEEGAEASKSEKYMLPSRRLSGLYTQDVQGLKPLAVYAYSCVML